MNPKLLQLLAANRKKGFFKAEKSATGESDTLYLYDMIVDTDIEAEWWGGVSPEAFIRTLNTMDAPVIHLRVKSPGGSVFAARAMEQALREHKSTIIAHIDGLAASAASFLITGADEIEAAPGSFVMIHKAWTWAYGNADDLEHTVGLLKQIDTSLVKTYAAHTGQAEAEIIAWMAAETWFEADRAAELGFIDRVAEASSKGEKGKASKALANAAWDLSAYRHAPAGAAPLITDDDGAAIEPPLAIPQPDRAALARAAAVRIATANLPA